MKTYKVITLCGSLKNAQEDFNTVQMILERAGHVCFSVGFSEKDYIPPTDEEKSILDKVHFKKILMSDLVLILDRAHYFGQSTKNEIVFANINNIPVIYLTDTNYFKNPKTLINDIAAGKPLGNR